MFDISTLLLTVVCASGNANVKEKELKANDPYYTGYHPQALHHWINDPNGPMYFNGYYHLFFQYNPNSKVWGPMHWYHLVSLDLLNWKHLPIALSPENDDTDCGGIFSGSASIVRGVPVLSYSVQCGDAVYNAYPTNITDPFLVEWVKETQMPVLKRPEGMKDFRDPTTAFRGKRDEYRMLVGCDLGACEFESEDFSDWKYIGVLDTVKDTIMWECPDLFNFDSNPDVYVLKSSPLNVGDWWAAGKLVQGDKGKVDKFIPVGPAVHKGQMVDYGNYYASKTFYDPVGRRQLLWGWINYTCPNSDWAGVQSLPREVFIDPRPADPNIWQINTRPIAELSKLHGARFSTTNVELEAGEDMRLSGLDGTQADISLTLEVLNWSRPLNFGMSLFSDPDGESGLDILWETIPTGPQRAMRVEGEPYLSSPTEDMEKCESQCKADRRCAAWTFAKEESVCELRESLGRGLKTRRCRHHQLHGHRHGLHGAHDHHGARYNHTHRHPHKRRVYSGVASPQVQVNGVLVDIRPYKYINMRVLVDHSVVEVFAQYGRVAISLDYCPPNPAVNREIWLFHNSSGPAWPIIVRELNVTQINTTNTEPRW